VTNVTDFTYQTCQPEQTRGKQTKLSWVQNSDYLYMTDGFEDSMYKAKAKASDHKIQGQGKNSLTSISRR